MIFILLLSMIFCHIVDDYYLQGILAQMKQKSWWEKNAPDKLYENDYQVALAEHAMSWAFMIHVPLIVYVLLSKSINVEIFGDWLIVSFIFNSVIHATIDDLKANQHKINLIQDQIIHIVQITLTFLVFGIGFLL